MYTLLYLKCTTGLPWQSSGYESAFQCRRLGCDPQSRNWERWLPRWLVLQNPPANRGDKRDTGSIPGWGRSSGEVNGTLLQHSCLENSMGREAFWAIVHGAPKNQTRLSGWAHHTQGNKIPPAPGHLSPGTTTREMPAHCNKRPTHHSEKTPQAATKT